MPPPVTGTPPGPGPSLADGRSPVTAGRNVAQPLIDGTVDGRVSGSDEERLEILAGVGRTAGPGPSPRVGVGSPKCRAPGVRSPESWVTRVRYQKPEPQEAGTKGLSPRVRG